MKLSYQQTPISVLQDVCSRHLEGKVPEYQLLSSECLVHKPTFVYRVEINGIVATASGQSKKKAKHAAAMNALQSLLKNCNDPVASSYVASYFGQPGDASTHQDRLNDALNENEVNSVGKLQELCMKKRWRPPSYETFEEVGAPHERLFRMICEVRCDGHTLRAEGCGRSKKLAKRSAAIEMLAQLESHKLIPENFLGSSGGVVLEMSQSMKPQEPLPPLMKTDLLHSSAIHAGDKVIEFMKGLGEELNHEVDIVLQEEKKHPCQALSTVADFLECQVQYEDMPSKDSSIYLSVVNLVPMDTFHYPIPVVSGFGSASSQDESRRKAAKTAISFLTTNRNIH